MQYTLVAFSAELDRRPLRFVRPVPPNRICSACRLLRPTTALLPCGHTLCQSCYEQCVEGASHSCPLDGCKCQDEEVDWRDFSSCDVLKRQVKCWNHGNGCEYVSPASGIVEHFRRDCKHHATCCPKCCATIPCCDTVGHLKSASCNSATLIEHDGQRQSAYKNESTFLTICKAAVKEQAGEVKESLGRLVGSASTHADRLHEISHAINSFKESVRQELAAVTKQNHEGLTQVMREIKASKQEVREFFTIGIASPDISGSITRLENTVKDKLSQIETAFAGAKAEANEDIQVVLDRTNGALRHIKLGVAHCEFFVKNVASLYQTAMKTGLAEYVSEWVYLRGYCMSRGVDVEKDGERVNLCASICIHKGDMDDLVQWPFEHKVKLAVMHPVQGAELVVEEKPARSQKSFKRPTTSSNKPCSFNASLDAECLINDGYVDNEQLLAKYYFVP
ncbi:TNF receptor-associated factor 3-like [Amblyomma americanum]